MDDSLTPLTDLERADLDPAIAEAARVVGEFFATRTQPPILGGVGDRFDVVRTMDGLPSFDAEYMRAADIDLGVPVKVLRLERILVSKRAANRDEDRLAIEQIERTLRLLESLSEDDDP